MDSTMKPEPTGAHDILFVRGDDNPASDYEKVVREELARVQERLAKLAASDAPEPPKPEIPPGVPERKILNPRILDPKILDPKILDPKILDPKILDPKLTTFRAAGNVGTAGQSRSGRKIVMQGATALLLALGAAGATVAWKSPYADAPKDIIARWAPQLASILSLPLDKVTPSADSNSPAVQTANADTAAAPAAAENPTQDATPAAPQPQDATAPPSQGATAAAPSTTAAAPEPSPVPQPAAAPQPDVTPLLQSMAHDLATLEQGMEQLKANQEQLTRENAKLAEQIKVSQEQMTRLLVAHEHIVRPRAPAPRPVAPRRPVTALPPPQAIAPARAVAVPPPPVQLQAEEPDPTTTLRPPKPVP